MRVRCSIVSVEALGLGARHIVAFSLFIHPDSLDPHQGQQAEVKTFTGRISKQGSKFILEDSSIRASWQLDDQQKAEKYQGKNVRVTGTLDAENNMIHVRSIEEAV